MHAPAHPPHQPPARGTVVTLRVLFVAVTVLSLGFLAWAALLRAALVQRKPLGWWLFGADLALLVGIVASGTYPETDWRTNVQVGAMLAQMAGAVAYYLVVDTRAARTPGHGAQQPAPPAAGYGYPPSAYPVGRPGGAPSAPLPAPYGPPPQPTPAPVYAQETQPHAPESRPPYANPYRAPQGTGYSYPPAAPHERPQRIDRVRAELDELSDYLRKEEGR